MALSDDSQLNALVWTRTDYITWWFSAERSSLNAHGLHYLVILSWTLWSELARIALPGDFQLNAQLSWTRTDGITWWFLAERSTQLDLHRWHYLLILRRTLNSAGLERMALPDDSQLNALVWTRTDCITWWFSAERSTQLDLHRWHYLLILSWTLNSAGLERMALPVNSQLNALVWTRTDGITWWFSAERSTQLDSNGWHYLMILSWTLNSAGLERMALPGDSQLNALVWTRTDCITWWFSTERSTQLDLHRWYYLVILSWTLNVLISASLFIVCLYCILYRYIFNYCIL